MSNPSDDGVQGATPMSAQLATATWLGLMLLTLLAWLIARTDSHQLGIAAIVILAAIKIYLIIAVFMGMWHAPRGWHALAIAWIVVTFTTLCLLTLRSAA